MNQYGAQVHCRPGCTQGELLDMLSLLDENALLSIEAGSNSSPAHVKLLISEDEVRQVLATGDRCSFFKNLLDTDVLAESKVRKQPRFGC